MGKLSEDLRRELAKHGYVPEHGYDIDGHRVMEDTVTKAQVGDGTQGVLTFEEGPYGLECLELTPEQAMWLVDAPHVRQLIFDALAVVVGWGMKFNELEGAEPDDVSQYPMATAASLIERAHALGMREV